MERRGTLLSLVVALMLAAFGARSVGTKSETDSRSQHQQQETVASNRTGKKNQSVQSSAVGPWKASQAHFFGQSPAAASCPNSPWCVPDTARVIALIAVVPDPVHTHLALAFDRATEAIQLAASSARYVSDAYWIPWSREVHAESSGCSVGRAEELQCAETEKQPGLVLFRWNGPDGKQPADLLYVFLVADTPTSGINPYQFQNAVLYSSQVSKLATSTIVLLGPSFSGSLDSLKRLTASQPKIRFQAYSGTVSSKQALTNRCIIPPQSDPERCANQLRASNLTFHQNVYDVEAAIREFLTFLAKRDHGREGNSEIAILSEAGTTFGAALGSGGYETDFRERIPVDSYQYPREISLLRNAQQTNRVAAQTTSRNVSEAERQYLELNLKDIQSSDDEIPDFSTQQGPLAKEAVLMGLSAELRRHHYGFVGIASSNVLDALFLSSFLRKSVPDARLFVFTSDLLFERELDNAPFLGMLALTSYPLLGANREWTHTQLKLPFSDQFEQSTYNSMILALSAAGVFRSGLNEVLSEWQEPFSAGATKVPDAAPLWLTVVGRNSYWPVQFLSSQNAKPAKLKWPDVPASWRALQFVLCALVIIHIVVILAASPVSRSTSDFCLCGPRASDRFYYLSIATAVLGAAVATVQAPVLAGLDWAHGDPTTVFWYLWMPIIVLAALFLSSFLMCAVVIKLQQRAITHIALLAGPWALMLTFCGMWWHVLAGYSDGYYGLFLAYRSLNLMSGVSPLMPLLPLLACLYVWALYGLLRLRISAEFRTQLNRITDKNTFRTSDSAEGNAVSAATISDAILAHTLPFRYVFLFCMLYAMWFFSFRPPHPFELFEVKAYTWTYGAPFCIVVAMMLYTAFRLWCTWSELRAMLMQLERQPIRSAFSRLRGFGWSPIWQQGGQEAEWLEMARLLESVRQAMNFENLRTTLACENFVLELRIKKVRDALTALAASGGWPVLRSLTPTVPQFQRVLKTFRALQLELAHVADRILRKRLFHFWREERTGPVEAETLEASEKKCAKAADLPDTPTDVVLLEEFVALRYVSFIRSVLAQMRHMLVFLALSFSLVLLSLNVYSFEPHQSLLWSFTAMFVIIGVLIITVLMQVYRDHILSRITRTKPNELGWGFYGRVASLGIVPLVTLLATHFPSIGQVFTSFIQPGLEALK